MTFKSSSIDDFVLRCDNGCLYAASGGLYCGNKQNGFYTCTSTAKRSIGEACERGELDPAAQPTPVPTPVNPTPGPSPTPGPTPVPKTTEGDCLAKGKSFGYVNGEVRCVNPSPDTPVTTTTQTTKTTTTDSGQPTTETTTKSTTDTGTGVKTTDTTTTTVPNGGKMPDGSTCTKPEGCTTTRTETTDQPSEEYCKNNPNAQQCKGTKSSVTASCEAFTCESDDAVSCEIAKVNWKEYCRADQDAKTIEEGDLYKKGQGAMDGTGLEEVKGQIFGDSSDAISFQGAIKTDAWLSRSCPQDIQVSVMGRSVTIALSKICSTLQIIGELMVAGAWIIAALIVFRG
ncbi:virulence factor TspB C-terminal domain-related protein [Chitinolyticbacter meiyuanensis]|uniref:virulence factor TspB C-terminal domain-related protein n=1 Tax=Chitinolyticbacter meiyuanensis TaxID=682798 RepID=UPI0011E59C25|nr:virulence factor TspB C-terminal domain-related protein [Chitinolyticbacter meiyuanensis]